MIPNRDGKLNYKSKQIGKNKNVYVNGFAICRLQGRILSCILETWKKSNQTIRDKWETKIGIKMIPFDFNFHNYFGKIAW